jgi:hypothetical protein
VNPHVEKLAFYGSDGFAASYKGYPRVPDSGLPVPLHVRSKQVHYVMFNAWPEVTLGAEAIEKKA